MSKKQAHVMMSDLEDLRRRLRKKRKSLRGPVRQDCERLMTLYYGQRMSRTQVAFLVVLAVVLTTAVASEDLPQDYYNSRLVNSMGNRRLGRLFRRFLEDAADSSVERPEKRKPCFLSGVTGPLCDYADVKDARKEHAWLEENSPGKRLVL